MGGIIGINVFVVLLIGIVSGSVIVLATGATQATDLLANMGTGAAGMYETTMVAIQMCIRDSFSEIPESAFLPLCRQ